MLVISGLHISLLALAVAGILRRLGFPMTVWVILSVGVLAGYGILIGQPTTAVRALLMFFVLIVKKRWCFQTGQCGQWLVVTGSPQMTDKFFNGPGRSQQVDIQL